MSDAEITVQRRTKLTPSRTSLDQSHASLDQSHASLNHLLWQYSYLQMLDFLTTVAFLLHGVREGNPLVRLVLGTGANPLAILLVVKLLAIMLGLYCWRRGRRQLLLRINILFALLVAWNLVALIVRSAT